MVKTLAALSEKWGLSQQRKWEASIKWGGGVG